MKGNVAENTEKRRICYRLKLSVKGIFYEPGSQDQKIPLEGKELAVYEKDIQSSLYTMEPMPSAPDNGSLFKNLSVAEIKDKIRAADTSVTREKGSLYGQVEIQADDYFSEWEERALSSYVKGQFAGGWGWDFSDREIPVEGGTLRFWFELQENCLVKEKKYEITDIAHPQYPWLHRIRALKQVLDGGGDRTMVRKGDLGGFVQSEKNLSQEGGCWIYENAVCCEEAVVEKEAKLFDYAVAKGSALITGDSCMSEKTWAEGNCCIQNGYIRDHAVISGDAVIKKNTGGHPQIIGNSRVFGTVCGRYVINDAIFPGEFYDNPTEEIFVLKEGMREIRGSNRKIEKPKDFLDMKKKEDAPNNRKLSRQSGQER